MHLHTGPEHFITTVIVAILGINIVKAVAGVAAKQSGAIGLFGRSLGALVE